MTYNIIILQVSGNWHLRMQRIDLRICICVCRIYAADSNLLSHISNFIRISASRACAHPSVTYIAGRLRELPSVPCHRHPIVVLQNQIVPHCDRVYSWQNLVGKNKKYVLLIKYQIPVFIYRYHDNDIIILLVLLFLRIGLIIQISDNYFSALLFDMKDAFILDTLQVTLSLTCRCCHVIINETIVPCFVSIHRATMVEARSSRLCAELIQFLMGTPGLRKTKALVPRSASFLLTFYSTSTIRTTAI